MAKSKRSKMTKRSKRSKRSSKKSLCRMFKQKKSQCDAAPMCKWRKNKGCYFKKGLKKSHDKRHKKMLKELKSFKLKKT